MDQPPGEQREQVELKKPDEGISPPENIIDPDTPIVVEDTPIVDSQNQVEESTIEPETEVVVEATPAVDPTEVSQDTAKDAPKDTSQEGSQEESQEISNEKPAENPALEAELPAIKTSRHFTKNQSFEKPYSEYGLQLNLGSKTIDASGVVTGGDLSIEGGLVTGLGLSWTHYWFSFFKTFIAYDFTANKFEKETISSFSVQDGDLKSHAFRLGLGASFWRGSDLEIWYGLSERPYFRRNSLTSLQMINDIITTLGGKISQSLISVGPIMLIISLYGEYFLDMQKDQLLGLTAGGLGGFALEARYNLIGSQAIKAIISYEAGSVESDVYNIDEAKINFGLGYSF